MSRRRAVPLALIAIVVPLSCSDDDGGSKPVADGIEQLVGGLPGDALGGDFDVITVTDLVAASEAAGVDRPNATASDDARREWNRAVLGFDEDSIVAALVPRAVAVSASSEELEESVGWSVDDIDRFAEVRAVGDTFTLIETNGVSADDLDAVFTPGDEDNTWTDSTDEDDDAMLTALDGTTLASTRDARALDDWRDGEDLLGDDDAVIEMAAVLDEHDSYAAMIIPSVSSVPSGDGSEDRLPDFDAMSIGLAVRDGDPVATLVYRYLTDEEATDAVARTRSVLTDEDGGSQVADLLDDVEVIADGRLVVVTGAVRERPAAMWALSARFDPAVIPGE